MSNTRKYFPEKLYYCTMRNLTHTHCNLVEFLAKCGESLAQSRAGWMYDMGRCVKQNDEKAFYWYTKAASQGDKNAKYFLGRMYFQGRA